VLIQLAYNLDESANGFITVNNDSYVSNDKIKLSNDSVVVSDSTNVDSLIDGDYSTFATLKLGTNTLIFDTNSLSLNTMILHFGQSAFSATYSLYILKDKDSSYVNLADKQAMPISLVNSNYVSYISFAGMTCYSIKIVITSTSDLTISEVDFGNLYQGFIASSLTQYNNILSNVVLIDNKTFSIVDSNMATLSVSIPSPDDRNIVTIGDNNLLTFHGTYINKTTIISVVISVVATNQQVLYSSSIKIAVIPNVKTVKNDYGEYIADNFDIVTYSSSHLQDNDGTYFAKYSYYDVINLTNNSSSTYTINTSTSGIYALNFNNKGIDNSFYTYSISQNLNISSISSSGVLTLNSNIFVRSPLVITLSINYGNDSSVQAVYNILVIPYVEFKQNVVGKIYVGQQVSLSSYITISFGEGSTKQVDSTDTYRGKLSFDYDLVTSSNTYLLITDKSSISAKLTAVKYGGKDNIFRIKVYYENTIDTGLYLDFAIVQNVDPDNYKVSSSAQSSVYSTKDGDNGIDLTSIFIAKKYTGENLDLNYNITVGSDYAQINSGFIRFKQASDEQTITVEATPSLQDIDALTFTFTLIGGQNLTTTYPFVDNLYNGNIYEELSAGDSINLTGNSVNPLTNGTYKRIYAFNKDGSNTSNYEDITSKLIYNLVEVEGTTESPSKYLSLSKNSSNEMILKVSTSLPNDMWAKVKISTVEGLYGEYLLYLSATPKNESNIGLVLTQPSSKIIKDTFGTDSTSHTFEVLSEQTTSLSINLIKKGTSVNDTQRIKAVNINDYQTDLSSTLRFKIIVLNENNQDVSNNNNYSSLDGSILTIYFTNGTTKLVKEGYKFKVIIYNSYIVFTDSYYIKIGKNVMASIAYEYKGLKYETVKGGTTISLKDNYSDTGRARLSITKLDGSALDSSSTLTYSTAIYYNDDSRTEISGTPYNEYIKDSSDLFLFDTSSLNIVIFDTVPNNGVFIYISVNIGSYTVCRYKILVVSNTTTVFNNVIGGNAGTSINSEINPLILTYQANNASAKFNINNYISIITADTGISITSKGTNFDTNGKEINNLSYIISSNLLPYLSISGSEITINKDSNGDILGFVEITSNYGKKFNYYIKLKENYAMSMHYSSSAPQNVYSYQNISLFNINNSWYINFPTKDSVLVQSGFSMVYGNVSIKNSVGGETIPCTISCTIDENKIYTYKYNDTTILKIYSNDGTIEFGGVGSSIYLSLEIKLQYNSSDIKILTVDFLINNNSYITVYNESTSHSTKNTDTSYYVIDPLNSINVADYIDFIGYKDSHNISSSYSDMSAIKNEFTYSSGSDFIEIVNGKANVKKDVALSQEVYTYIRINLIGYNSSTKKLEQVEIGRMYIKINPTYSYTQPSTKTLYTNESINLNNLGYCFVNESKNEISDLTYSYYLQDSPTVAIANNIFTPTTSGNYFIYVEGVDSSNKIYKGVLAVNVIDTIKYKLNLSDVNANNFITLKEDKLTINNDYTLDENNKIILTSTLKNQIGNLFYLTNGGIAAPYSLDKLSISVLCGYYYDNGLKKVDNASGINDSVNVITLYKLRLVYTYDDKGDTVIYNNFYILLTTNTFEYTKSTASSTNSSLSLTDLVGKINDVDVDVSSSVLTIDSTETHIKIDGTNITLQNRINDYNTDVFIYEKSSTGSSYLIPTNVTLTSSTFTAKDVYNTSDNPYSLKVNETKDLTADVFKITSSSNLKVTYSILSSRNASTTNPSTINGSIFIANDNGAIYVIKAQYELFKKDSNNIETILDTTYRYCSIYVNGEKYSYENAIIPTLRVGDEITPSIFGINATLNITSINNVSTETDSKIQNIGYYTISKNSGKFQINKSYVLYDTLCQMELDIGGDIYIVNFILKSPLTISNPKLEKISKYTSDKFNIYDYNATQTDDNSIPNFVEVLDAQESSINDDKFIFNYYYCSVDITNGAETFVKIADINSNFLNITTAGTYKIFRKISAKSPCDQSIEQSYYVEVNSPEYSFSATDITVSSSNEPTTITLNPNFSFSVNGGKIGHSQAEAGNISYSFVGNYKFASLSGSELTVYNTVSSHIIRMLVSFTYNENTYYGEFNVNVQPNVANKNTDYSSSTDGNNVYTKKDVGDVYIYSTYSEDTDNTTQKVTKSITINSSSTTNSDSIAGSKYSVSYDIAKIYNRVGDAVDNGSKTYASLTGNKLSITQSSSGYMVVISVVFTSYKNINNENVLCDSQTLYYIIKVNEINYLFKQIDNLYETTKENDFSILRSDFILQKDGIEQNDSSFTILDVYTPTNTGSDSQSFAISGNNITLYKVLKATKCVVFVKAKYLTTEILTSYTFINNNVLNVDLSSNNQTLVLPININGDSTYSIPSLFTITPSSTLPANQTLTLTSSIIEFVDSSNNNVSEEIKSNVIDGNNIKYNNTFNGYRIKLQVIATLTNLNGTTNLYTSSSTYYVNIYFGSIPQSFAFINDDFTYMVQGGKTKDLSGKFTYNSTVYSDNISYKIVNGNEYVNENNFASITGSILTAKDVTISKVVNIQASCVVSNITLTYNFNIIIEPSSFDAICNYVVIDSTDTSKNFYDLAKLASDAPNGIVNTVTCFDKYYSIVSADSSYYTIDTNNRIIIKKSNLLYVVTSTHTLVSGDTVVYKTYIFTTFVLPNIMENYYYKFADGATFVPLTISDTNQSIKLSDIKSGSFYYKDSQSDTEVKCENASVNMDSNCILSSNLKFDSSTSNIIANNPRLSRNYGFVCVKGKINSFYVAAIIEIVIEPVDSTNLSSILKSNGEVYELFNSNTETPITYNLLGTNGLFTNQNNYTVSFGASLYRINNDNTRTYSLMTNGTITYYTLTSTNISINQNNLDSNYSYVLIVNMKVVDSIGYSNILNYSCPINLFTSSTNKLLSYTSETDNNADVSVSPNTPKLVTDFTFAIYFKANSTDVQPDGGYHILPVPGYENYYTISKNSDGKDVINFVDCFEDTDVYFDVYIMSKGIDTNTETTEEEHVFSAIQKVTILSSYQDHGTTPKVNSLTATDKYLSVDDSSTPLTDIFTAPPSGVKVSYSGVCFNGDTSISDSSTYFNIDNTTNMLNILNAHSSYTIVLTATYEIIGKDSSTLFTKILTARVFVNVSSLKIVKYKFIPNETLNINAIVSNNSYNLETDEYTFGTFKYIDDTGAEGANIAASLYSFNFVDPTYANNYLELKDNCKLIIKTTLLYNINVEMIVTCNGKYTGKFIVRLIAPVNDYSNVYLSKNCLDTISLSNYNLTNYTSTIDRLAIKINGETKSKVEEIDKYFNYNDTNKKDSVLDLSGSLPFTLTTLSQDSLIDVVITYSSKNSSNVTLQTLNKHVYIVVSKEKYKFVINSNNPVEIDSNTKYFDVLNISNFIGLVIGDSVSTQTITNLIYYIDDVEINSESISPVCLFDKFVNVKLSCKDSYGLNYYGSFMMKIKAPSFMQTKSIFRNDDLSNFLTINVNSSTKGITNVIDLSRLTTSSLLNLPSTILNSISLGNGTLTYTLVNANDKITITDNKLTIDNLQLGSPIYVNYELAVNGDRMTRQFCIDLSSPKFVTIDTINIYLNNVAYENGALYFKQKLTIPYSSDLSIYERDTKHTSLVLNNENSENILTVPFNFDISKIDNYFIINSNQNKSMYYVYLRFGETIKFKESSVITISRNVESISLLDKISQEHFESMDKDFIKSLSDSISALGTSSPLLAITETNILTKNINSSEIYVPADSNNTKITILKTSSVNNFVVQFKFSNFLGCGEMYLYNTYCRSLEGYSITEKTISSGAGNKVVDLTTKDIFSLGDAKNNATFIYSLDTKYVSDSNLSLENGILTLADGINLLYDYSVTVNIVAVTASEITLMGTVNVVFEANDKVLPTYADTIINLDTNTSLDILLSDFTNGDKYNISVYSENSTNVSIAYDNVNKKFSITKAKDFVGKNLLYIEFTNGINQKFTLILIINSGAVKDSYTTSHDVYSIVGGKDFDLTGIAGIFISRTTNQEIMMSSYTYTSIYTDTNIDKQVYTLSNNILTAKDILAINDGDLSSYNVTTTVNVIATDMYSNTYYGTIMLTITPSITLTQVSTTTTIGENSSIDAIQFVNVGSGSVIKSYEYAIYNGSTKLLDYTNANSKYATIDGSKITLTSETISGYSLYIRTTVKVSSDTSLSKSFESILNVVKSRTLKAATKTLIFSTTVGTAYNLDIQKFINFVDQDGNQINSYEGLYFKATGGSGCTISFDTQTRNTVNNNSGWVASVDQKFSGYYTNQYANPAIGFTPSATGSYSITITVIDYYKNIMGDTITYNIWIKAS
jgi:hypothetical protein